MDEQKPTASDSSKSAVVRRLDNVRMAQNVLVIWLDSNIDDNSADCQHMITQLQHVVNTINTFADADQCRDFLTKIYNEKVVMIMSDTLCENFVPLIHDIMQIDTILIFSENKTKYERWAKDWCKIKGIFTEISSICEALKQAVRQCEQNSISISFVSTNGDISNENLDQLDVSFMYTQILKEIILTIKFKQEHIKEFSDYCCEQSSSSHRTTSFGTT
ncbi:unnamed protein product [Rotaria sp. Silwood2]|nr:unnamed protein product [Rotaria sp. Silwood2]CAF2874999.1 unnamed protein product [Rotaria sp. Silwood2]CAF3135029.1 unnamed protein product [Rotaria sp. Silwood2]CAF3201635.1 unnamed protein product [Rotaria sp. Silwood2]CAF4121806.1 unnamed protein product [Rotaria sp. Silwood2]